MKVKLREEKMDVIYPDQIGKGHIVVAVIGSNAAILTREKFREGNFIWKCLNNDFLNGNEWPNCAAKTIEEAIENVLKYGNKVACFNDSEWFKAMEWLRDNIEGGEK